MLMMHRFFDTQSQFSKMLSYVTLFCVGLAVAQSWWSICGCLSWISSWFCNEFNLYTQFCFNLADIQVAHKITKFSMYFTLCILYSFVLILNLINTQNRNMQLFPLFSIATAAWYIMSVHATAAMFRHYYTTLNAFLGIKSIPLDGLWRIWINPSSWYHAESNRFRTEWNRCHADQTEWCFLPCNNQKC